MAPFVLPRTRRLIIHHHHHHHHGYITVHTVICLKRWHKLTVCQCYIIRSVSNRLFRSSKHHQSDVRYMHTSLYTFTVCLSCTKLQQLNNRRVKCWRIPSNKRRPWRCGFRHLQHSLRWLDILVVVCTSAQAKCEDDQQQLQQNKTYKTTARVVSKLKMRSKVYSAVHLLFSYTTHTEINPINVPNCCCSKGSAPYSSNPPFLIFDIPALWRSVLSERPNVKN